MATWGAERATTKVYLLCLEPEDGGELTPLVAFKHELDAADDKARRMQNKDVVEALQLLRAHYVIHQVPYKEAC